MLLSEQIHSIANDVGDITNRAYMVAPSLVQDLQGLQVKMRSLYEAAAEFEPSREEIREVEHILKGYPSKKKRLALAKIQQIKSWMLQADSIFSMSGLSCSPQKERIQGGVILATAERILEAEETLIERVCFSEKIQKWSDEVSIIEVALAGLPVRLRSLIACRYFGNLPVDEVCDRMAISRPTYYRLRDEAFIDFQKAHNNLNGIALEAA
jgi:hypothetical protein